LDDLEEKKRRMRIGRNRRRRADVGWDWAMEDGILLKISLCIHPKPGERNQSGWKMQNKASIMFGQKIL